jgi:hypothetical protein
MSFHTPWMVGPTPEREAAKERAENWSFSERGTQNPRIRCQPPEEPIPKSRITSESTMFKENVKEILRSASKLILQEENVNFIGGTSEGPQYHPREANIFLTINDESFSNTSQSPQPRDFCQPVFEEEYPLELDMQPEVEKKKVKAPVPKKQDHSMLSLLLNNPLGEVTKKRKAEGISNKTSTTIASSRLTTLKPKDSHSKNLKAVKRPSERSKTPLATKDMNSQLALRKSQAEGFSSPFTKLSKLNNYEVGKVIAKGSYSVVKHAVNKKTGQAVAIKFYDNNKLNDSQKRVGVTREIAALKLLDHPNIIGLVEDFTSRTQTCIVMELTSTCTLYQYTKSKAEKKLSCKGMALVHQNLLSSLANS